MPLLTLERHVTEADRAAQLRADVVAGLTASPKHLAPKWFYDARGSELFERITRLPEYYPTRTEREILTTAVAEIAEHSGAETLIELGSGSSEKTGLLLDALAARGTLRHYVPVDVSEAALTEAAATVARDYPDLVVGGLLADFEQHLHLLPDTGRRMVAFLGGTVGNLAPRQRNRFLSALRRQLRPGESLLLGVGLVTEVDRLVRAYDDAEGVTAEFNRNVLWVINNAFDADFMPTRFGHVALWDAENEWIEMRLRSDRDQTVVLPRLNLRVEFAAGEQLRTEISAKFTRSRIERELPAAGFGLSCWWPDPNERFALALAVAQ